jgi:hypothetical protein
MITITLEFKYSERDSKGIIETSKELAAMLDKLKDHAAWLAKATITDDDTQT